ncbi:hypothetical protein I547_4454 [Mycobacterium kansasii 824]|uniref:Uncharacterized protein n=1 Tax=Mycobacterium kansasii TaxID=1768 RepID=A0A1V3WC87_MYCKA|nr:hypothetical protein I547_4454 [Mycobacterium kansasii 824]KEP40447.1 hypothetical protein MKSMC1_44010 [Mycobacterium kansasii]OOK64046.1 hypothetical protein BZL29_8388 [Mycobacterium kansasii]
MLLVSDVLVRSLGCLALFSHTLGSVSACRYPTFAQTS